VAETHSNIYLGKKYLIWTIVFIIWAFLTKSYLAQINDFFDSIFGDGRDTGFYFPLALFLGGAIFLAPFVGAANGFTENLNLSLKDPRFHNQRRLIFVGSLCFLIVYLQLLFVTNYEGYFDALLYNLGDLNFFKLGAISYVAFFYFKRNGSSHISKIATVSCWFFIAMYLWSLYFSLGLDDGCRTVDGDPLFGGGGYEECDPDFINQKDQYGEVSKEHGLKTEAIFATELIISQIAGVFSALIGYGFGKRRKFIF